MSDLQLATLRKLAIECNFSLPVKFRVKLTANFSSLYHSLTTDFKLLPEFQNKRENWGSVVLYIRVLYINLL